MSIVPPTHIVADPSICGGAPRIDGTRIRVIDIAAEHEFQGLSPEEICGQHPALTLADVHAALAYYFDHLAEFQAALAAEQQAIADFRRMNPNRTL